MKLLALCGGVVWFAAAAAIIEDPEMQPLPARRTTQQEYEAALAGGRDLDSRPIPHAYHKTTGIASDYYKPAPRPQRVAGSKDFSKSAPLPPTEPAPAAKDYYKPATVPAAAKAQAGKVYYRAAAEPHASSTENMFNPLPPAPTAGVAVEPVAARVVEGRSATTAVQPPITNPLPPVSVPAVGAPA